MNRPLPHSQPLATNEHNKLAGFLGIDTSKIDLQTLLKWGKLFIDFLTQATAQTATTHSARGISVNEHNQKMVQLQAALAQQIGTNINLLEQVVGLTTTPREKLENAPHPEGP